MHKMIPLSFCLKFEKPHKSFNVNFIVNMSAFLYNANIAGDNAA